MKILATSLETHALSPPNWTNSPSGETNPL